MPPDQSDGGDSVHRIAVLVFCALLSLAASAHDKVASNVGWLSNRAARPRFTVTLADQADIASLAEKHSGDDRLVSSVAALDPRGAIAGATARWLDKRGEIPELLVANFIALEADQV